MSYSATRAQALSSVPLSLSSFAFKAMSQTHLIVPRFSARNLYAQALGSQQEGAHKLSGPLRARCDHREWQNARVLSYEQHSHTALSVPSDWGWKFPHAWLSPFLHTGVPNLSWRLQLRVALLKVPTSELGGQNHLRKSHCLVLLICFKSKAILLPLIWSQSPSCAVCATYKSRDHK